MFDNNECSTVWSLHGGLLIDNPDRPDFKVRHNCTILSLLFQKFYCKSCHLQENDRLRMKLEKRDSSTGSFIWPATLLMKGHKGVVEQRALDVSMQIKGARGNKILNRSFK